MGYGGSKRLGLPDQVIGHWVRGTVGLNEVVGLWVGGTDGLNVRRVSGMRERFKFGWEFRLRSGFRVRVSEGNGFRIRSGFGLWAMGYHYGLRGIGPRVRLRCGFRLIGRVGPGLWI